MGLFQRWTAAQMAGPNDRPTQIMGGLPVVGFGDPRSLSNHSTLVSHSEARYA